MRKFIPIVFFLSFLTVASCQKMDRDLYAPSNHTHQQYADSSHTHSVINYQTYELTVDFIAKKNEAYIYCMLPLPEGVNSEENQIFVEFNIDVIGYTLLPLSFQGETYFYSVSGNTITFYISTLGQDLLTRTKDVSFKAKLIVFPREFECS